MLESGFREGTYVSRSTAKEMRAMAQRPVKAKANNWGWRTPPLPTTWAISIRERAKYSSALRDERRKVREVRSAGTDKHSRWYTRLNNIQNHKSIKHDPIFPLQVPREPHQQRQPSSILLYSLPPTPRVRRGIPPVYPTRHPLFIDPYRPLGMNAHVARPELVW